MHLQKIVMVVISVVWHVHMYTLCVQGMWWCLLGWSTNVHVYTYVYKRT